MTLAVSYISLKPESLRITILDLSVSESKRDSNGIAQHLHLDPGLGFEIRTSFTSAWLFFLLFFFSYFRPFVAHKLKKKNSGNGSPLEQKVWFRPYLLCGCYYTD